MHMVRAHVLKASSMALGGGEARFKKSNVRGLLVSWKEPIFGNPLGSRQKNIFENFESLFEAFSTFVHASAGVVGTGQRTACTLKTSSTCHCGRQPVVGECMQVRERICMYCIVG